jgi:hypothetical protein
MPRASPKKKLSSSSSRFLIDMPLAFAQSREPGLILLRGGNYSDREARELVQRVLRAIPLQQLTHCLVVVDHGRLRKVRLPLHPA